MMLGENFGFSLLYKILKWDGGFYKWEGKKKKYIINLKLGRKYTMRLLKEEENWVSRTEIYKKHISLLKKIKKIKKKISVYHF